VLLERFEDIFQIGGLPTATWAVIDDLALYDALFQIEIGHSPRPGSFFA
jgi:hypothetical protein